MVLLNGNIMGFVSDPDSIIKTVRSLNEPEMAPYYCLSVFMSPFDHTGICRTCENDRCRIKLCI
jgi:hypothetical protein